MKYARDLAKYMRSSTDLPKLERLVTGERCDVNGCYGLAVWLVTSADDAAHICVKHTRIQMKDSTRWQKLADAMVDA